jgi:hypothetical protein
MNDIEKSQISALDEFSKKAAEKLRYFTNEWYSQTSARASLSSYQRTYEFLNSITVGNLTYVNGAWEVDVYFDPAKMTLGENGGWNQHEDRYYLSEIIEYGWRAGRTEIQGSEAKFKTIEWAEEFQSFLKDMKKSFELDGFRIK